MLNEHDVRATTPEIARERLAAIRAEMQKANLAAYLLPRSDEFQGEYVPPHAMRLAWLTGFTGSAGMLLVTPETAVLFIDGRYTLQVTQQTSSEDFQYEDLSFSNVGEKLDALIKEANQAIGYDAALWTPDQIRHIQGACRKEFEWAATPHNLVSAIWQDAPRPENATPSLHPIEFAGKTTAEKLPEIWATFPDHVDLLYIAKPEDVCWVLNVRSTDVPCTPLVLSTLLVSRHGQLDWFIDGDRADAKLLAALGPHARSHSQSDLGKVIEDYVARRDPARAPLTLAADYGQINMADLSTLTSRIHVEPYTNPTVILKAQKNHAEQAGARHAHEVDGVAMVKFLHWLDTAALAEDADEMKVDEKLLGFRKESPQLRDISFETIAGAGPNGAIVHYRVTAESSRKLAPNDILLVDSGGQYPSGTTDITRTVVLGEASDIQRRRFTQVLQGHIDLARIKFPKGVSGAHLDTLARAPLWMDGVDFAHGTGHGVGSYLSVHEGPQGISRRANTPLMPGMLVSNEPGYYEANEYGIRIESVILVNTDNDNPNMLCFETLTLAPIQKALIDTSMLSTEQRDWLNQYHEMVYTKISPHLDETLTSWLAEATSPLELTS